MKLIEVIPISRGIPKESLNYFSSVAVPVGSVVKVPLRKNIIPAIVVSERDVEEAKSDIKNSSFPLKKIENTKYAKFLTADFVEAGRETAKYFAGTTGSVLFSLVPKILLENVTKIEISEISNTENKKTQVFEKFVIQASDDERYANYKSLIREEFAKNLSVFFCLPTIQDIKKATEKLQKGIEKYTYFLHSSMSEKEMTEIVNKILSEKHPVLIIGTGGFLSIPKEDIGTLIIDRENSRSYKNKSKPYIDIRYFAEKYAEKTKIKLIFGDMILRTETIWRYKNDELIEISPLKFRSLSTMTEEIVDMKAMQENNLEKPKFTIISDALERLINKNISNNEHLFMFIGRRGLSPSVVCADCGTIVGCKTCKAHTVLHKSSTENFFLCHKCGERRSALEKCALCDSWKLTTLGIGTELVEQILLEKFPEQKIFKLDSDSAGTHKKATQIIEKFYTSPQGILIGTEMALLYLTEKVENSAVVSMDSFFSIPDYRINERILNILLKIRSITNRNFLIQTRDSSQKVFDYASKGNLIDFYKEEISIREKLDYPPFSVLIKVIIAGNKNEVLESVEHLQKELDLFEINVFPAFIPGTKGKYAVNGIIKIPKKDWPNEKVLNILKSLPPNFSVNIDPENLL
ncbi:MAG: primosomal protein N' [Minisyncoccia bacterium]